MYLDVLQNHVKPAVRRKRPEMVRNGVILLHDNAGPHRKGQVVDALQRWGWECLPHPLYSPDLSPCDFFLFPRVKESLRGKRFADVDAINAAFKKSLSDLAKSGTRDGIHGLLNRWEKCIQQNGDYVE